MLSGIQQSIDRFAQPIRFGLVGLSGVIVNSVALWALARGAQLALPLASILATEAAVLSNFVLNDRWTFHAMDRRHSLGMRLLRFNGVSLGGMAITAGVLTLLTSYAQLHLLIANLLAIGGAMAWNYLLNSRWTWRRQSAVSSQQSAVAQRDAGDWRLPTGDCPAEKVAA